MIKDHSDKFIVLSACMAGEVSRALMNDNYEDFEDEEDCEACNI